MKPRICCVVGTRPEAIKMAPVVLDLVRRPWADVRTVNTSQHRDLVEPILDFFAIEPSVRWDVMEPDQDLTRLMARLLDRFAEMFRSMAPDMVIAQGDTATVLAAAMACFFRSIPFAHVEAGLRTGDVTNPFPEEFNRIVADRVSSLHFAPTATAADNLIREGIGSGNVHVVGNTVIDALFLALGSQAPQRQTRTERMPVLLVTLHRRETLGPQLDQILDGILGAMAALPDLAVVFPVHPNPNVRRQVGAKLGGVNRIRLEEPMSYPDFVRAMYDADVILTDSGGIQEEAPALGKPVLVARTVTERPDAIDAGVARLVGTDADRVASAVCELFTDPGQYRRMSAGASPYGDGRAAVRIGNLVGRYFDMPVSDGSDEPEFVWNAGKAVGGTLQ